MKVLSSLQFPDFSDADNSDADFVYDEMQEAAIDEEEPEYEMFNDLMLEDEQFDGKELELLVEMNPSEVGPGDSFTVKPKLYNDATEDMYVFIQVDQPEYTDGGLYTYEVNSAWKLIEDQGTTQIYAYAGDEMLTLTPGETTDLLTDEMTMKEISNAEYSQIDDLNVSITGYAIGTEDISVVPSEAWKQCKAKEYIG